MPPEHPDLSAFRTLSLATVLDHAPCTDPRCAPCRSTAVPGARAQIERRAQRGVARRIAAQIDRIARHGLPLSREEIEGHLTCNDRDCPICRSLGDGLARGALLSRADARTRAERTYGPGRESGDACHCGGGCDSCASKQDAAPKATDAAPPPPPSQIHRQGPSHDAPPTRRRAKQHAEREGAQRDAHVERGAPSAMSPFSNTLMPEDFRRKLQGGRQGDRRPSSRRRMVLGLEANFLHDDDVPDPHYDPFGCPSCGLPTTEEPRERDVRRKGTCPVCAAEKESEGSPLHHKSLIAGRTWYVSPFSGGGTGKSPSSPMSLVVARKILEWAWTLPDTTFLFDASQEWTEATMGMSGHQVSPYSPCWLGYEVDYTDTDGPSALLVIRASGESGRPLTIGSYRQSTILAAPKGGGSGSGGPTLIDPDDVPVVISGGRTCGQAPELAGLEWTDYPTHRILTGILVENACNLVIQDLEISGFDWGIMVLGHCRQIELTALHIHRNAISGISVRGCPELFVRECASTQGYNYAIDANGCPTGKSIINGRGCTHPAWLSADSGYPDDIEIHHCMLMDNGLGQNSQNGQILAAWYATGLHIHHNLIGMTADGPGWDQFPPRANLIINSETVDVSSDLALTSCGAGSDLEIPSSFYQACCGVDWEAEPPDRVDKGSVCSGCELEDPDCLLETAKVLVARGACVNPLEAGKCWRRGGDAMAFQTTGTGHLIEYNVVVGNNANCEGWLRRPDPDKEGAAPNCYDATDGEGIDLKGVRARTPTGGEITVIRHNTFLFNGGWGIQVYLGTQGIDIYRNVFAGNGGGIRVASGIDELARCEWKCTDDCGDDGTVDFVETGCLRIYRNLILRNNRNDANCDGAGEGWGIHVDVAPVAKLGSSDGVGCDVAETAELAFRVKDLWIVNNTIDGNAWGGIVIDRTADCMMEGTICRSDGSTGTAGPAVRIQDVYILNNLLVGNNAEGGVPGLQLLVGGLETWWAGHEDEILPLAQAAHTVGGVSDPNVDVWMRKGCNEDFVIEHNFYVNISSTNKIAVFGGVQSTLSKLDSMNQETWWFGAVPATSNPDEIFEDEWASSGYTTASSDWDWLTDVYDFQADWGTVESLWTNLSAEWNPASFRLAAASATSSVTSIANAAETVTLILDHGAYSTAVEARSNGQPFNPDWFKIDVGEGPDFFYDEGHNEIGAFEVDDGEGAAAMLTNGPDHPRRRHSYSNPAVLAGLLVEEESSVPPISSGIFPDMTPQIAATLRPMLRGRDVGTIREALWAMRRDHLRPHLVRR